MDCIFCKRDKCYETWPDSSEELFHSKCHNGYCCPAGTVGYQPLCPRCQHLRLPHLACMRRSSGSLFTMRFDGLNMECHLCQLVAHTMSTRRRAMRRGPRTLFDIRIHCTEKTISIWISNDNVLIPVKLEWWQKTSVPSGKYLRRSGHFAETPGTDPRLGPYVNWVNVSSVIASSLNSTTERSPASQRPVRLQVIDVQQDRVIEAPANCDYIALSYVFGSSSTINLTCSRSFDRHSLPRTIRDALVACQELRFRYLWVDQLCINQADHVDLLHQIDQMSRIYECAACTIVALAGEDSSHGLPGVTNAFSWGYKCITIDNISFTAPAPDPGLCLTHSKWYTRGWTFQEAMFSSTLILFSSYGVYIGFRNKYGVRFWSESERRVIGDAWQQPLANDYWEALEHYTCRELTYPSDILRAFSAVLQTIHGDDTYYGLPFRQIDEAVLWRPENTTSVPASKREGFPSWSWASHYGPIARPYYSIVAGLAVWAVPPRAPGTDIIICRPSHNDVRERPHPSHDYITPMSTISRVRLSGCLRSDTPSRTRLEPQAPSELVLRWPSFGAYWDDAFDQYRHDDVFSAADIRAASISTRILVHGQTTCFSVQPNRDPLKDKHWIHSMNGKISGFLETPQYHLQGSTRYMAEFIALSVAHEDLTRHLSDLFFDGGGDFDHWSSLAYLDEGGNEPLPQAEFTLSKTRFIMLNVMLIQRNEHSNMARRLGIGQIFLRQWAEAEPRFETIVLE